MGKTTGFMEYAREEEKKRDPLSRLDDWKEYTQPFSEEVLARQAPAAWIAARRFAIWGWS